MSYVFPFDAKGSAFQCAREYFGYMLAHFVVERLLQELVLGQEVRWVNDNKAALCWADENKCNSPAAQYAFMVVSGSNYHRRVSSLALNTRRASLGGILMD